MDDNSNKIEYIADLINGCLLPPLIQDLGFEHIDSNHFSEFRSELDLRLVELFDFVQANEEFIHDIDGLPLEIKQNFIILLCEQTAPNTLFQTNKNYLLRNIDILVENHFKKLLDCNPKLFDKILDYYRKLLVKDTWRKNLGAIHSFERFCNLSFLQNELSMNSQTCIFALSVGLLFEEFYEPLYKELGFRIFNIILHATPVDILKDLNIHDVIYDTAYKNIQKITHESGIKELWNCLLVCMDLFKIRDFSKWNKLDNLLDALVNRIALQSDSKTCCFFFKTISKLIVMHSPEAKRFSKLIDSSNIESLQILRDECSKQEFLGSYRFAKTLLKLFVAESYRLQATACVEDLLNVNHLCYLTCIFHIPLQVIAIHLGEFFGKFVPALLKGVLYYKDDENVKKSARMFLQSFSLQINGILEEENKDLFMYKTSLENIMLHDIFK